MIKKVGQLGLRSPYLTHAKQCVAAGWESVALCGPFSHCQSIACLFIVYSLKLGRVQKLFKFLLSVIMKVKEEEDEIDRDISTLSKEELARPIKKVEEKWKMLPYFLKMRGLMRQHVDSFNHFINVDMKEIVAARSNREIRSEADPKFFLSYTDIYVGEPNLEEEAFVTSNVTPFQCRLRDCTYSAPLYVNIKYTRQRQIVVKNGIQIGRIPIMLRSEKCVLNGKNSTELAAMKECEYDPGGYFVVKGNEKVLLMHEQLSKNLI
eukprot:scaffold1403_cov180-Ochromonas_danica.AAC.18